MRIPTWRRSVPQGLRVQATAVTQIFRYLLRRLARHRVFRVTIINREAVPNEGPVIIACNHISISDPVFLWGAIRRNAVALAMAELWKIPVVAALFRTLGYIPVDRGNRKSGRAAIEAAIPVLEHAGVIIIFPEGKLARNDTLLPFKSGVAELSLSTGTPVVPVGIKGSDIVKPTKDWRINRKAPVTVEFGDMLYPENYQDTHMMLQDIRLAIAELSERNL